MASVDFSDGESEWSQQTVTTPVKYRKGLIPSQVAASPFGRNSPDGLEDTVVKAPDAEQEVSNAPPSVREAIEGALNHLDIDGPPDDTGKDEYFAERQERQAFLQEYNIDMPPPVQTFRQRYNAQTKSVERFVLDGMQLENFKSYANKVPVGAFNPKFTCVIGPNGSGKSNTIDALLFVFGYNNKRIRASKTSELIHKSDAFPNFRSCRVTVNFKRIIPGVDAYDYTEVKGSRYSVSREATRDGKSTFFLDGQPVTRDKVRTRLLKDGIDLDQNRFLILQGEVEQIAMMKPKGKKEGDEEMLEYVEEIIGTHQYKQPIADLNVLVEKLAKDEELQNMKVHEFGKQMNGMEAVKNETERFLRTENEAITKNHVILQIQRTSVTAKRDAALVRFGDCQKELEAKQLDLNSLTESRQKLEKEHEDMKRYIRDLERGDSAEEKNFRALETQRNKLQTKKKTIEESLPKLEAAKLKLDDQLLSKQDAPKRLRGEIEALEEDVSNTRQNLDLYEKTVREKMEALPGLIGVRHQRVADLEANLTEARQPLLAKRRELDNKEVEHNAFRAKYTRAVEHREALAKRQTDLTAESALAAQEIERLEAELPAKRQTLGAMKPRMVRLRGEIATLKNQTDEKRGQIDKAAEANRIQTNDRALKRLLEAQRDGDLEGVIGLLGDLAMIDAKYDVAVSTNFGWALDKIVVKDVAASKSVLQYAEANSLGRLNLIVLDEMVKSQRGVPNRAPNLPPNSERIFDLINIVNDIYRPVFYYFLSETLVTDTLERASAIAFPTKQRVVTLDGKLIDGNKGSYTGGGDAVIRGKIRTNAQGFQTVGYKGPPLAELEAQCQELEQQATNKQTELAGLEIELGELEPEIRHLEQALAANTTKQTDGVAELERLKGDLKKQAEAVKAAQPDEHTEARFEGEIRQLRTALEADDERVQAIQHDLDVVNGEIVTVTKQTVDEWRNKEKKAKTTLAKLEKEVFAKKSELDNHGAVVAKLERDLERQKRNIADKQAERETILEELDTIEKEWITARNLLKEQKEKLQGDKAAEKAMSERITVFDSKIDALESEAAHCKAVVDKADSEAKAHDKHWKAMGKEMDALTLNDLHTSEPAVLKILPPEELAGLSIKTLEAEIANLKVAMNTMQPKMNVWTEYFKLSDSRDGVMKAVEEVRRKRKLAYGLYMEFKNRRFSEFMEALRVIQTVLKTTYRQLTLGGDASLEPLDRFDPFSEGLEFMVKPKTKSWKNISYLSGGEKTISSLSLIFALHYFKPTPFYIMDEIDAALDFRNTSIIAFFVKERALAAQFIIVSLRNQMFETAYRLIGICKPDHQSMAMFIDPAKHVHPEHEKDTANEPRPTVTTIGRQTTGSLFSQATQGAHLQADEDRSLV